MKEKCIKVLLIIIGILSLLWLVISCLNDSPRNLVYLLPMLFLKMFIQPWILLGLICLFVGIAMPFKKNKKEKAKSKSEINKQKKIWKILLITGISVFSIPLIVGIYDAIVGTTGMCMFDCTTHYGFEAFMMTFPLMSLVFIPGYILGAVLIVLSLIKLKKK